MTGDESYQDGDCSGQRRNARLPTSQLIADGGPSRRQLFRGFPDPLVYYEIEQDTAVVRAVNPAFERTFDIEESAITDDRLVDHLLVDTAESEPDSSWVPMDAAGNAVGADDTEDRNTEANVEDILAQLNDGERVTVGFRRGADGEQRYFRLENVSTPDEENEGYVVYTGVTGLEQQVQNLRSRAERLERVVSITAHDLRNPLDVAKIRLEAARDTGEDVHFEKVEGAIDRIQRIIRNVLSVGGGEVDPNDVVGLDVAAEEAWSTVETADATLVLADDLPTIRADADHLQQVFENLFRNAVEHGGRDVTVTVGSLTDGFYVADDGPGIPPPERERAFEPGYSTADDNTGLGLAIVQQIAEDHGWQVAFTVSDAGGARFAFSGVETDEQT